MVDGSEGKESACSVGDLGSNPDIFCLENSMDRGAWQATAHGVTRSWTRLSDFHFHF